MKRPYLSGCLARTRPTGICSKENASCLLRGSSPAPFWRLPALPRIPAAVCPDTATSGTASCYFTAEFVYRGPFRCQKTGAGAQRLQQGTRAVPSVIEAALLEPRSPALQAPATCPTPLLRTAARQAATSQTRPCAEHHSFLIILGSKSFLLLRAPQRPIPAFLLFPAKAIALLLRAAQQRLLKLSLLPRWVSGLLLYLSSDGDLRQEFAVKLETSSIYIFIYIFLSFSFYSYCCTSLDHIQLNITGCHLYKSYLQNKSFVEHFPVTEAPLPRPHHTLVPTRKSRRWQHPISSRSPPGRSQQHPFSHGLRQLPG